MSILTYLNQRRGHSDQKNVTNIPLNAVKATTF